MRIKVTDFAKRQFDPKIGGTRISSHTIEEFESEVDALINSIPGDGMDIFKHHNDKQNKESRFRGSYKSFKLINGYAPFCKLLAIENFTTARTGTMEITMENNQYLQTDYSARTEKELPVLSRFLQLPPMFKPPTAEYLILVLYDREHIEEEIAKTGARIFDSGAEWGIVSILGQMHNDEEPMNPITMMRNSLGMSEGGSGVDINKEAYQRSIDFWRKNAIVK